MGAGGAIERPDDAPSGTVTFLFTDIVNSTRLWQSHPHQMEQAVRRHDDLVGTVVVQRRGRIFASGGDGFSVAFPRAANALAAAADIQEAISAEPWTPQVKITVRMGVHTGEAAERGGDFFGTAVNRAARIAALANGGQVLVSSATLTVVEERPTTTDLGSHHLRGLRDPVRIHQLGTASFPPLQGAQVVPTNLPVRSTEIVGRTGDVAALAAHVDGGRIVTLAGTGGIGKTRLAVEVAASAGTRFPDGVWFVDLVPIAEGGELVRAVAAAMGATSAASDLPSLLRHLKERRTLLLLDNCEHVIDAAASLVDAVVSAAPDVVVLATSREPLEVAGEIVHHVRPLGVPGPAQSLEKIRGSPAVWLFEERARAVREEFAVDERNAPNVIEICRRLDGMPLAIELAAARVATMSTRDICDRLDERFRLLATSRRGRERHRTLLAAVEWSYDLLGPEQQAIFRRLSVFAGSFDLVDAVAVAGDGSTPGSGIEDGVTRLADQSLVVHDGETGRYRLLETLRQFGADRLAEVGETEAARDRFIEHYLSLAAREGPRVFSWEAADAGPLLSSQLDNLRLTADLLATARRWDDLATLVSSIWRFLGTYAPTEAVAWLRPALVTGEVGNNSQAWYDALVSAGALAMLAARFETAVEMHARARALLEVNPDIVESAWAEVLPVITALYTADLPALAEAGQHMADVAQQREDHHAEQFARSTLLFLLAQDPGELEAAIAAQLAEAAPGGPMWTGNLLASAAGALMAGPPETKQWRTVLALLDQNPSWQESGYVLRTSIMSNQAAALTFEDPAGAISVALEVVHETDRLGGHHIAIGSLEAAALAAAKLGERDHAARLLRHAAATAPFVNPWSDWIRDATIELLGTMGLDPAALTPQELGRAELFATFADLERSPT